MKGKEIKKLRKELGLTQQELADRAGCTRQTIILLERRRYVPSLALAFEIARTFSVPIEEVFQYEENQG